MCSQSIRTVMNAPHGQWVKDRQTIRQNMDHFVDLIYFTRHNHTHKMETAGEEKRSLVLPSRSFNKAGYRVDTPPKDQQQWITRQRAAKRVQVSG